MSYRLFCFFSLIFIFSTQAEADLDYAFDGEAIFDYRSDRIRENINTNETRIRNISLFFSKDLPQNSRFAVEILGDEGVSTDGVDLSLGELHYSQEVKNLLYGFSYRAGVLKVGYGLLNPMDGMFYRLPSFYQFLYGLPRGLDTGLTFDLGTPFANFTFGFEVYAGRNLRSNDLFQRRVFGTPYSINIKYRFKDKSKLRLHYFTREYEGSPQISGYVIDYSGGFKYRGFDFAYLAEVMSLKSSIGSIEDSGDIIMLMSKISYKSAYINPIFAYESWESQGVSTSEQYLSVRFGVNISKYFGVEVEQIQIEDTDSDALKEDSWLVRAFINWTFNEGK